MSTLAYKYLIYIQYPFYYFTIVFLILASSFRCPGTANTCIPAKWQCDGEKDCPDGKDEIHCEVSICENWQFKVDIYLLFIYLIVIFILIIVLVCQ